MFAALYDYLSYVRKTVQATEEQYDQLATASRHMSTEIRLFK